MTRAMKALALCGLSLTLNGCIAAALAWTSVVILGSTMDDPYILEREYDASFEHVMEASVQAMNNLQYHSVDQRRDAHRGAVEARRADDKLVRIVVVKQDVKNTCVKVRVSDLEGADHLRAATMVHDRILANIK